jgi:Endonuclease-reverse transcriptase
VAVTGHHKEKGGGLAFIFSDNLSARPIKMGFSPMSFELQLVGLQVNHIIVKVASMYRPPDSPKSTFIHEFTDLLTTVWQGCGERLIICGDFNMPGVVPGTIDERLSTLLDVHGYLQHITQPTRGHNLLDLLITPALQPLVTDVTVLNTYNLSNHNLVTCDLSVRRHKPDAVKYKYHDIKKIDIVDFERRLRSSQLFTDPADTPDEYLSQLESTVLGILDEVAPIRQGTRAGGRKAVGPRSCRCQTAPTATRALLEEIWQ